jgi:hypothetical protein
LGQLAVLGAWEAANQLIRQQVAEYGTRDGIVHAQHVVQIEQTHGFFVEPVWQQFVLQSHRIFGAVMIPWLWQAQAANAMYEIGHVIFPLLLGLWVFFWHTDAFPVVRNAIIAADILALIGYRLYPTAPPRLTPGLWYDGHPFHFTDISAYWAYAGSEGDEFAAMPSIHIAYALIVGITLVWLLRHPVLRVLALLYPVIMLVAVVSTANHYIMDGLGAIAVISIAYPVAFGVAWLGRRLHGALYRRMAAPGLQPAQSWRAERDESGIQQTDRGTDGQHRRRA